MKKFFSPFCLLKLVQDMCKRKSAKSYLVLLEDLLEANLEKSNFFLGGWFVVEMADTYVSV